MIRVAFYEPSSERPVEGGPELIDRWAETRDGTIWVHLSEEETESESRLLADRFQIHPLAITDALRDRHPPKIEAFDSSTFLLLKGLDAESDTLQFNTIQLSLFIGDRFLVTRSPATSLSCEHVLSQLLSGEIPAESTPARLALRICRRVADRFAPVVLAVEERLEQMERMMLSRPSDALLAELVRQKADLKRMLRILQYHEQVFTAARSGSFPRLAAHHHELADVHEQLDRLRSLARLYYELTDDLMTGYLSLSAHKLNQIMQTLTIVTVIFVPITFMAGIYGMNFEHMPELGFRYGYFLLLGAMLAVVIGALWFFHRRGWLRTRPRDPR